LQSKELAKAVEE